MCSPSKGCFGKPLPLVAAILCSWLVNTLAWMDSCFDRPEILADENPSLSCADVVSLKGTVVEQNCSSHGHLCRLSCGMCDQPAPSDCDQAEVHAQKSALVSVLSGLAMCFDCEAPDVWTVHTFIGNGSWASSAASDPCRIRGVSCNRCGEPFRLVAEMNAAGTAHLSPLIFRLTVLQDLIVWLASGEPVHYINGSEWPSLPNLTYVVLSNALRGDFPDFSAHERLYHVVLVRNQLQGSVEASFGGEATKVFITRDSDTSGQVVSVTDRLCDIPMVQVLRIAGVQLKGEIPSCLSLKHLRLLELSGTNLTGDIGLLLQSDRLMQVMLDDNSLSGTLPETISACTDLETLSFAWNRVSGTLPDMSNMAFNYLDAGGNFLGDVQGLRGGGSAVVYLNDNVIAAFPTSFMSLVGVEVMDLSWNLISYWPPAGVFGRELFGDRTPNLCAESPMHPPFDWPDMEEVVITGNDLQGQDIREVLGSFASLPRLIEVAAQNCNLTQDLQDEAGLEAMLPQLNPQTCALEARAFNSLRGLRLGGNRIEAVGGHPWRRLVYTDLSRNRLTHLHHSWVESSPWQSLIGLDLLLNPDLRLPVEDLGAGHDCWNPGATSLGLWMDPQGFLQDVDEGVGYRCTTVCVLRERQVAVWTDASVNASVLCRCRAGWYGEGMNCSVCGLDEWCEEGSTTPSSCPVNSSTLGATQRSREIDCECDAGLYRRLDPFRCHPCPENTFRAVGGARAVEDCAPCPKGFYSDSGSASDCSPCPIGSVALAGSGSGCLECGPGQFARSDVQRCVPCPVGQYQPASGTTACISCAGEHNLTWANCSEYPCLQGEVEYATVLGSDTIDHCGCEAGFRPVYLGNGGEACAPCGYGENEGLECAGGHNPVLVARGYYTPASHISVYKCWGDEDRCIGGLPGQSCSEHRVGLTCATCDNGYVAVSGGECARCAWDSWAMLCAILVLLVLLGVIFYHTVDRHTRVKQRRAEVLLTSVLSLLVTMMQQLGLLSQLAVQWLDPLKSVLDSLSFLSFDLEGVLHIDCISPWPPVLRFLLKLSLMASFCALMLILHFLFVMCRHRGRFRERKSSMVCSIGGVITLLYMSVVAGIVQPLQCQKHPNSKETSKSYPTLVCWESSEHWDMFFIAMAMLTVPLGYYAHAMHTVFSYPARVSAGDMDFLKAYDFYFVRFKAEAYWFILICVGRGLILGMSIVIIDTALALFLGLFLIIVTGAFTVAVMPWRSKHANNLDMLLTFLVLVLFSAGFVFIPEINTVTKRRMSLVSTASTLLVLSLVPMLSIGFAMKEFLCTRKVYDFFLCHHKDGAGAFTRLLKTYLQDRSPAFMPLGHHTTVFIDSDNLKDLDRLFYHVGHETQTLVAIWSSQLLLRPWCAGEIATARLRSLQTLVLRLQDYTAVTQDFLASYSLNVDLSQIFEYGLTWDNISHSMLWLDEQPKLVVQGVPTSQSMEKLASSLHAAQSTGGFIEPSCNKLSMLHESDEPHRICCDDFYPEGIASGMLLERFLVRLLSSEAQCAILPVGSKLPASVDMIIFVCSAGCFESPPFLALVSEAAWRCISGVPVIAQSSFEVPAGGRLQHITDLFGEAAGIRHYIAALFKKIAVAFHAQHASGDVLRHAALMVAKRVKDVVQTSEELTGTAELRMDLSPKVERHDPPAFYANESFTFV